MFYYLFRIVIRSILKAFFKLKVEGLDNLPKVKNFIVAANHSSYLDPLAVGSAIPYKIHWISVRQSLFISNCWHTAIADMECC